jgi:hypothetical protein
MKDAAAVLDRCGINIVFAECSPVGYHHAVWNIVGEAARLKPVIDAIVRAHCHCDVHPDESHPLRTVAPTWREEAIREIGMVMLAFQIHVEKELRRANKIQIEDRRRQAPGISPMESRQAGFFYARAIGESDGKDRDDPTRERRPYLMPHPDETSLAPLRTALESIGPAIQGVFPELADNLSLKALDERWHYHALEPVRLFRGLQQLAYFWTHGSNVGHPLGFRYDGLRHLLKPDASNALSEAPIGDGSAGQGISLVDLPTRAIASFDRVEHYVRLQMMRKEEADRLLAIEVRYRCEPAVGEPAPSAPEPSSRGLLHRICHELEGLDLNLRRVSNRITDYSQVHETGSLRIVGQAGPGEAIPEIRTAIGKAVVAGAAWAAREGHHVIHVPREAVTVKGYARSRVFISMPMEFSRRPDVVAILRQLGDEEGIEPVFSETYGESTTWRVREDLRECEGFLQLITLRDAERHALMGGGPQRLDFAWLLYEYGLADGLNRRPIRVLDKVISDTVFAQTFKIARDVDALHFDTGSDQDTLRQDLAVALATVIEHVLQR